MKKRIEKYFPAAMDAIARVLLKNNEIPREYQGYASAFGASILQMGLMPTLAVHADKESGSAQERPKLLHVLALTMMKTESAGLPLKARNALQGHEEKLFEVAVNHPELQADLREALLDAIVAVKLCMRTFKMSQP